LSIDPKKFVNVANGAATSDYNIQVASAGLSANRFDAFAGGGSSSASVTLTGGRVDLQNSPNQFADTAGPNTAGNFKKLNVSISRLQAITSGTTLLLQASGQATHKNLDSSEKIYLGGAASVRAYPSSEVGGVAGRTFTVELRQQLWNALSLTGFYDWGRIQVNHTPFGASTVNDLGLQGRGFSLAWQPSANIDLKASVARRHGSNPSANPLTGLDTDGSFKLNRVWLNASIAL
jgi:hemolysin activation/secretion protein